MKFGWRWFGPDDPVTIEEVMHVGATEVVSALHHIPNGEVWPVAEIRKRQYETEFSGLLQRKTGLNWSVVESVPVHEDIKKRNGDYLRYIKNYKQTLRNLAACGMKIVVYNFMPVLDWTRTNLDFELANGTRALRYDAREVAVFDLFILKRENALREYSKRQISAAKEFFDNATAAQKKQLTRNVIAGLPGAEESFSVEEFRGALRQYDTIGADALRSNLVDFLRAIVPVAEQCGIRMAIHPDDPPWPLFGIPRVMSSLGDARYILQMVDSPANCINLCAGSLGAADCNDLPEMFRELAGRIPFVHLRSVRREPDGSFFEDAHLEGSVDLCALIREILRWENQSGSEVIIRPDHGQQMLDDLHKTTNPGYSCIGRMKGLAEIKGMAMAIQKITA